ncbi:hypothetical protein D3C72_1617610 [compost metagenome]
MIRPLVLQCLDLRAVIVCHAFQRHIAMRRIVQHAARQPIDRPHAVQAPGQRLIVEQGPHAGMDAEQWRARALPAIQRCGQGQRRRFGGMQAQQLANAGPLHQVA